MVDTKLIDVVFEPTASYVPGSFRAIIRALQPRLLTPDVVAHKAIAGIERDKAVIVGAFARVSSTAKRLVPPVTRGGSRCRLCGRSARHAGRAERSPRGAQRAASLSEAALFSLVQRVFQCARWVRR